MQPYRQTHHHPPSLIIIQSKFSLPHLHLTHINTSFFSSQPTNTIHSSPPSDLPPSDWNITLPGPLPRRVTFYNYGYPLSPSGLEEVIGDAYLDATTRHQASERILTFGYPLRYVQHGFGPGTRVLISFRPGPGVITWGEWANAVVALEDFTWRWDNVALNFLVGGGGEGEGEERLGIGCMKNELVG